jgi:lysophospholipase L1-like esterase
MVGGVARLTLAVLAVLAVVAGALELGLRAAGAGPHAAAGLSRVVPDAWTGFRPRPGVSGEEAAVTNDLGMRAPRSYALARPPGALRVAVLGSSVVFGMGTPLADTIPAVVERELQAAGRRAEVLNFGAHAYTIVNVSALLQAYAHQFRPDVVVAVVDLQVGFPDWPAVRPGAASDDRIEKLGWWEALRKRGAARSALVALFDDPRPARRWARRATGLPLRPPARPTPRPRLEPRSPRPVPAAPAAASSPAASEPADVRAYEEKRERELAAPLAAMAAFCAEKSIALYFVTPYGPYFDVTEEELAGMSVHGFLEEGTRVHGSERAALGTEVELITRVARRVAAGGSARVIDMLEASRGSSLRTSADFTWDGVHLSRAGNAALGRLIAERVLRDFPPRSGEGG